MLTKLCECGCGSPTLLAASSDRRWGLVKGQPTNYIKGHGVKVQPVLPRLRDRFVEDAVTGCWNWTGWCRGKAKYAAITVLGVDVSVSRWMLEFVTNEPAPVGMMACHTCDNPPCINPAHLFWGTAQDNTQDCIEKGRFASLKGEANGHSVLTEDKVALVKGSVEKAAVLARRLEVSPSTICAIRQGRTWAHVAARVS